MACFIVPAAEAVVTTIVKKSIDKNEKGSKSEVRNSFLKKMNWLNNMLWGGSALLMFEHIWHGEVIPWFPFLTNAANPIDASAMVHEMATAGVGMAMLVTAVWIGMVLVTNAIEKRPAAKMAMNGGKRE